MTLSKAQEKRMEESYRKFITILPHVVFKDEDTVVGYCLSAYKEGFKVALQDPSVTGIVTEVQDYINRADSGGALTREFYGRFKAALKEWRGDEMSTL